MATKYEEMAKHVRKTSEHHADLATEHQGLSELHKAQAGACEERDDAEGAEFHKAIANRHTALAKCHSEHAEECLKAADKMDDGGAEKVIHGDALAKIFGHNPEVPA
jgi:hypothetical protein